MTRPCDPSSKVDLRPFGALPPFQNLSEAQKADPEIKVFYQTAASYARIDSLQSGFGDGNGILTLPELDRYLAKNPLKDPDGKAVDACRLLNEAGQFAAWVPQFKSKLQQISEGIKEDPTRLDLRPLFGLAALAPKFVEAEPTLKALMDAIGKKNAKGEVELVSEARDGFLTLEEFKKLPAAKTLKEKRGAGSEEAFLAKVREVFDTLRHPIYLWPKELKAKIKAAGENEFQKLSSLQKLSEPHRRSELVVGLLESFSRSKFEQEKIRHGGPAGNSYLAKAAGYLFFRRPWNKHFQELNPKEMREERDQAIEVLKKTMRERSFSQVKDAVAYLKANGQSNSIVTLEEKCDLGHFTSIAEIGSDLERSKAVERAARKYRLGKIESFWNWEIFPYPRLGRGGFFERASTLKNWTWLKTPELPQALSLLNFLATKTPNALRLFQEAGTPVLLNQLSPEDQRTYQLAFQAAVKAQGVDIAKVKAFLSKTSLSPEGQETLLSHLKREEAAGENHKIAREVFELPFVKKLKSPERPKPKGPLARKEKIKLQEENKNLKRHQKLQSLFGSAMAGAEKPEKFEQELGHLGFSKSETKTLKDRLKKIRRVSIQGPNFLFEEPLFGNQGHRAKGLFLKKGRSVQETEEMKGMIAKSRLSELDRIILTLTQEPVGIETLLREGRFGSHEDRLRKFLNLDRASDSDTSAVLNLISQGALTEGNRELLRFAVRHGLETRIARQAQEEFMAILGSPSKNPLSGDFDPKSVGNLHNALHNTVTRGVGIGLVAAPTLAGGGVGFTLAKAAPHWAGLGGLAIGAGLGFISPETGGTRRKLSYALAGAGIGGAFSYGLSHVARLKGLSPWWGAGILSLVGAGATLSPWGKNLRQMGGEIVTSPYRSWSDFSISHLPEEALGLYGDFALGVKGMEGILDGVKLIGALELGQRTGRAFGASALGLRKVIPVGASSAFGAWQGYERSDHRSPRVAARDTLIGMAAGGLFTYGLYRNKLWTFTGGGAAAGGAIGYHAVDPDDKDDWKKRVRYAMVGSAAGGALLYLLGRGVGAYFKAGDQMLVKNAEGVAKGQWISPWAEAQHAKAMEQFGYLEEALLRNLNPKALETLKDAAAAARADDPTKYWQAVKELGQEGARLTELHQLALSFEKLGKASSYPRFSANVLFQAERLGAAGDSEASLRLILKGAAELQLMEKGGMANTRIAKLLLTGAVADGVDGKLKPKTPLIPPFDDGLEVNPKKLGQGM